MRIGKSGYYSSHALVPTPDNSNFVYVYKFAGDGKMYEKNSAGISTIIGGSSFTSKGTFNSSGLSFSSPIDFSNEDFGQYSSVAVNAGNSLLGATLNISDSAVLEYFYARLVIDTTDLIFEDDIVLKKLGWFPAAASVLTDLTLTNLPLLTELLFQKTLAPFGILENVSIVNCPLLIEVRFDGNALGVSSVDNILSVLDANGLSGGSLLLGGGTNAVPTGGPANVNLLSLVGKGWTVTTN